MRVESQSVLTVHVRTQTVEMRKEWLAHDSASCMVRSLALVCKNRVWSASPSEEAIRIWDTKVRDISIKQHAPPS
jgi:hypothetical protein